MLLFVLDMQMIIMPSPVFNFTGISRNHWLRSACSLPGRSKVVRQGGLPGLCIDQLRQISGIVIGIGERVAIPDTSVPLLKLFVALFFTRICYPFDPFACVNSCLS